MKISRYQHQPDIVKKVSFEDYHQAIEDEISIYSYQEQDYIVIEIEEVLEEGCHPYVVFQFLGPYQTLILEENDEIVQAILSQYEQDE
ncbi:MAG: hypothetical protein NC182_04270 [Prevotella sp.]|nr:hypothetical protein [Staphylococcus sp.]MCM1350397.1 hypothetical protein [Prevotella sp.]